MSGKKNSPHRTRTPRRGGVDAPVSRDSVDSAIRHWLASFSATRHFRAYLVDGNLKHIAAGWRDFRKHKIAPDESMLLWIDCLADAVLNPPAAKARPKEKTLRDLDILRDVDILKRKHGSDKLTRRILDNVTRKWGVSVPAVKMIVHRAELMARDPYYNPKAFRK